MVRRKYNMKSSTASKIHHHHNRTRPTANPSDRSIRANGRRWRLCWTVLHWVSLILRKILQFHIVVNIENYDILKILKNNFSIFIAFLGIKLITFDEEFEKKIRSRHQRRRCRRRKRWWLLPPEFFEHHRGRWHRQQNPRCHYRIPLDDPCPLDNRSAHICN